MKLPLRMSLVAKRPRPVFERPTRNGRRELDVLDMMVTRASPLWTATRASSALACYAGSGHVPHHGSNRSHPHVFPQLTHNNARTRPIEGISPSIAGPNNDADTDV